MHVRAVRDASVDIGLAAAGGSQRLTTSERIEVEGRTIGLTNLDRVLWPESGFTKGEMVAYYRHIGPALLPHLAGRPVMLGRFPEGVDRRGWGQFECRGRPEWMASASLRLRTGVVRDVCVINDLASLVWVANQGVIELHPYLARVERFDQPLAAVFDLDPGPPAGLRECCRVALWLRDVLTEVGLSSFPKTSGSSGLHVVVPLNAPHSYEETKRFARAAAARLARERGELVVDRMAKSLRAGKVFIDWAQNDQRKQTVAPYSLRATPMPLVSAPVTWVEVERAVDTSRVTALALGPRDAAARRGRRPVRRRGAPRATPPAGGIALRRMLLAPRA